MKDKIFEYTTVGLFFAAIVFILAGARAWNWLFVIIGVILGISGYIILKLWQRNH